MMSVHADSIHFPCQSSLINIRLVRRDLVPRITKLDLRCRKTTFIQWRSNNFYLEGPFGGEVKEASVDELSGISSVYFNVRQYCSFNPG